MSRRTKPAMVLPSHNRADGRIDGSHWTDIRVPAPLGSFMDPAEPAPVGHYLRADECPDGRHLFDVIESLVEREVEDGNDEDGYTYRLEHDFRARLTCVRCGLVLAWDGTRDGDRERVGRVDPAPMVAGTLAAQLTKPDTSGFRDMSAWTVYRDGAKVGEIVWARGPRGRMFYTGRLDSWPTGQKVEAADPAAALRKLEKATRVQAVSA